MTGQCWGNNTDGQLGNGTAENSSVPVTIMLPANKVLIFGAPSTGAGHACGIVTSATGIESDFLAVCWGNNSSGQLGNGTTANSTVPVFIAGGLLFELVSAGDHHTCALTTLPLAPSLGGAVYCWGDNTYGQLGNTWTTSSSVPVNVTGAQ